jgi:hypothetical protein
MDVKMKSETRNPKSETNPKPEVRRTSNNTTTSDSDFGSPAGGRPIRLQIERLVLDGFQLEPGAATRVREAIESELARRLTAGGLLAEFRSGGAVPSLSGGEVHWKPGLSPFELGARIAGAIHASLAGRAAVATRNRESPCISS